MFKILDGRSYLYQWDLDRKLIVDDNTINKVYFCNKLGNCSIVRCVYDVNGMRLVDVPNLILQKAFNMYVYGYDSNYTKYEEAIEIKARTKPEDYVYTDEEIKVWDELEQRITELEENGGAVKSVNGLVGEVVLTADDVGAATKEEINKLKFNPANYNLPILALTGETAGMDKENAVSLNYVYGDKTGICSVKWQGSSSLMWEKKNYTIKFDDAFEVIEGWGAQKKYCFKANYIDFSHSRNIVNAKLWGEIVKSRKMPLGILNSGATSDLITYSNGEFIANNAIVINGAVGINTITLPTGRYNIMCDAYCPATDATTVITTYIMSIDGTGGNPFIQTTLSATETWETITTTAINFTKERGVLAIQGQTTKGCKFRNIRIKNADTGEMFYINPIQQIQELPNGGAIDGFPCIITLNGEFHGLYTFNIPKDGWMMGMKDGEIPQAILCADTQNEACGFKAEATLTDDFKLEYVANKEDANWVLPSLNRVINACINSNGTDIDTTIAKYIDINSAIDYLIFCSLVGGTDMYRKNYLLATYDGVKWFFGAYDMDTTYGLQWHGKGYNGAKNYPYIWDYNHKLMELLWANKRDAVKARYKELRETVLSEENIYLAFSNYCATIPAPVSIEDAYKWTTIPGSITSNTAQILNWYRMRVAYMDAKIEAM